MLNAKCSVVIPTLNEAIALPGLLAALRAQSAPPHEIIVADAGSRDGTIELAQAHGARVVPGGRPAVGRNAGARMAQCDLLLFLDADVLPGPAFIAGMLAEFHAKGYGVATCLVEPIGNQRTDRVITDATNVYMQVVQSFSPHAPGFCILIKRAVHEQIGGFNEVVKMAEDHDYVQRAAEHVEFGVLTSVHIPTSMRRIEKEGLTGIAVKYLWCELHALARRPVNTLPFEYEFGAFTPPATEPHHPRLIDITQLRHQLGQFTNPLVRLSAAGRLRLDEFLTSETEIWRERLHLPPLDPPDLSVLQRYLRRRRALLRLTGRPLRETLAKLQQGPIQESIRLLDLEWWQARNKK